jgi:hypothetical protein
MDETQFDAWTRRRFGLAAGGAATAALAGLLGSIGLSEEDAEAARKHRNNNNNKNRKKNKNKNKNKKQCRKLGQSCDETRKKQQCCSNTQLCAQVADLGSGNFCCKQLSQNCSSNEDCCGSNRCRSGICQTP